MALGGGETIFKHCKKSVTLEISWHSMLSWSPIAVLNWPIRSWVLSVAREVLRTTSAATIMGSMFDPSGLPAGSYTVTFTLGYSHPVISLFFCMRAKEILVVHSLTPWHKCSMAQPGNPGVYTKLSFYDEWIRNYICEESAVPPVLCADNNSVAHSLSDCLSCSNDWCSSIVSDTLALASPTNKLKYVQHISTQILLID